MTRDDSISAIRNGAIAALISAAVTLLVVAISVFGGEADGQSYFNDPYLFIDVVLILILAFGIYRKSRLAAVVMFVYFLLSKIMIGVETGKVSGLFIAIIFLYYFGKAIQGTFAFHKLEKAENPDYRAASKGTLFVGIPALVIIFALVTFGAATMTGFLPSTEVQSGEQMWQREVDILVANGIIYEEDKIEYFYSEGLWSILEGGQMLVQDRVISYGPDENQELMIYELYYKDIVSIDLIEKGGVLSDTSYKIQGHQEDAWLMLWLSAEGGGDEVFIDALYKNVRKARNL
jgi:hypothetical protein